MNGLIGKEILSKEWLLLILLCLVLYLPNIGGRELWSGRETLYAQVARETLLDGHWFVPHFNGEVYYNKPPLYFWLIAISSLPAGDITPFTLRLPSALSAMGTVLVVFLLGGKLFGVRTGFLTGVILASSPQFQRYACVAKLEMPLTFFIAASITAFYYGFTSSSQKKRYFLLGWFLMALAVLTKGLGLLLIPPVILLYLACRRELHRWREAEPFLGGLIFIVTILIWLIPAYAQGGSYYIEGLLGHFSFHVTREPRIIKPFYYILEVFVGMLPWSVLLLGLFFYYRKLEEEKREGLRLPFLWFGAMFILFCLIMSKRSRYILPLYPAVALVAGVLWEGYFQKASAMWSRAKLAPIFLLALLAGLSLGLINYKGLPLTHWVIALAAVCLVSLGIVVWLAFRAGQFKALFVCLLLTATSFEMAYSHIILPRQSQAGVERAICLEVLRTMEPGSRWVLYKFFSPDYVFYSRAPLRSLDSEKELSEFFASRDRVYCLLMEEDYTGMNPSGFKIAEFKKAGKTGARLILISNKPGLR